ncbi:MAG: TrkA family potassium uptake protein [Rhodospirillales bacterium]|nr:MAG: TrkA family potassium uptake protein [Rhodospirillales bacterium]
MRVILVGASAVAVATAEGLIARKHDVVIIEQHKERIDALKDTLDCGYILGDGTKPAILREVEPAESDLLLCVTGNDQSNILASLVGRSLGFSRIVTKIEDPEFEHICRELGLSDIIIPDRNTAQRLVDMATGRLPEDFAAYFKGEVRLFSFVLRADDAGALADLDLPDRALPIIVYRDDAVLLPDSDTQLKKGDEVVLVTDAGMLTELEERWHRTG